MIRPRADQSPERTDAPCWGGTGRSRIIIKANSQGRDRIRQYRGAQKMGLAGNIALNSFSILVLIIISVSAAYQSGEAAYQNKFYTALLYLTAFLLLLDILSRLDGYPNTVAPAINRVSNFLMFLLCPLVPWIWLMSVYDFIYQPERLNQKLLALFFAVNTVYVIILLFSLKYHWFYYIDSNNIYHRGPFFPLASCYVMLLLAGNSALIAINRKRMEKRRFWALQLFGLLPAAGVFLQAVVYGVSFPLNATVLSLLISFLYLQNQGLHEDFLTGIYNRKMLETYLDKKISASTEEQTFSAIMLDLDNFKYINDTYGHNAGDETLRNFAELLKSCLRLNDFAARYGGDEFCIVLETSDAASLQRIVDRIDAAVEKYNETSGLPYRIGISMGYAVYEFESHMDAQDFQRQIDRLMYAQKPYSKQAESTF